NRDLGDPLDRQTVAGRDLPDRLGVGCVVDAEGPALVLGDVRVEPGDAQVTVALHHGLADLGPRVRRRDVQALAESSLHQVTGHPTPPVYRSFASVRRWCSQPGRPRISGSTYIAEDGLLASS